MTPAADQTREPPRQQPRQQPRRGYLAAAWAVYKKSETAHVVTWLVSSLGTISLGSLFYHHVSQDVGIVIAGFAVGFFISPPLISLTKAAHRAIEKERDR